MPLDGCYNERPWEKIEGIIDNYCPVYYYHEYYQLIEAYDWFINERILPYGGGIIEQPYLIMQYLKLIRSVVGVKRN
jgi:hypothetical protein